MSPHSEGTILYRLQEIERRLGEQHDTSELIRSRLHEHAQIITVIPDHNRRLLELEAQNIGVLAARFDYFEDRVDTMTKWLVATAGSLLVAAAVFALSVASGQIG